MADTDTEKQGSDALPHVDSGFRRFFTNQSRFEFIGRSRTWLIVSLALVALCLASVGLRGLNFGIDFTGGTSYIVADAPTDLEVAQADELRGAVGDAIGTDDVTAQIVDGGDGMLVTTPALEDTAQQSAILDEIVAATGVERETVDVNVVGPRWGEQITERAFEALGAFLLLVLVYITLRFEWRMAAAAIVTLFHDIVVTIGVYALVGFQVSPASVIALLTILGYSLYDTVVIFDRVTEDTKQLASVSNQTYGEVANEAVNQVLLRSLSTSVTSLLPVGCLLLIGAQLLGADTLQDLALALFIGMGVGTYSSIFVATPLLVWLKEKEPRYAELRQKVLARRGGEAAAAVAGGGGDSSAAAGPSGTKGGKAGSSSKGSKKKKR